MNSCNLKPTMSINSRGQRENLNHAFILTFCSKGNLVGKNWPNTLSSIVTDGCNDPIACSDHTLKIYVKRALPSFVDNT